MGYTFSALDEAHILMVTVDEEFDMVNDMIASSQEVIAHLDKGPEGVIVIIDGRATKIKDLNSLLLGAQNITHPEVKASMSHPKLLKTFSVVDNKVAYAAMKGLNTATFGFVQMTLFNSLDDALAQARTDLAAYFAR